ncbi:hypothetical protein A2230_03135 [candidate division WOR-1 bacterium RIFOXYA2_FULL_36_21]|nr:MAG: hypothetical protein A2230_03135 [candidate division WOR-1 bacterium RIFOXYA2_FULL_36_21]OGC19003.1 MAG: hypothetical protein A2282_02285 [candidate division WOR-1 bacterium RIFOXYA12_FULL_36_13]
MSLVNIAARELIYHAGGIIRPQGTLRPKSPPHIVISPNLGEPLQLETEREIALVAQLSISDKRRIYAEIRHTVLEMFGYQKPPLFEKDKASYIYKFNAKIILVHPNNPGRLFEYRANSIDFEGAVGKKPSNGFNPYRVTFRAEIDMSFANLKEEEKDIYFNKIHEYLAEVLNKELGSIDCEVRLKIFNLRRNKILEIYGYIDIYSFKEKTLIVPANMVEKSIIFTPGHLNYDGI